VLTALRRVDAIDRVLVVTADPAAQRVALHGVMLST